MFTLSQRFAGSDADTEIEKALELLKSYNSQPLNDSQDTTAMARDRVMGAWNQEVEDFGFMMLDSPLLLSATLPPTSTNISCPTTGTLGK